MTLSLKYVKTLSLITFLVAIFSNVQANRHIEESKMATVGPKKSIVDLQTSSLEAFAKPDLELVELSFSKDTLCIVSTNRAIFYPFGSFSTAATFSSENRSYKQTIEIDKAHHSAKLYRFTYKNSFIKFYRDSEQRSLEIVSGKILNEEIMFKNGIKPGISKIGLLKLFFKDVPADQLLKIKNIKLISGLDGITHTYLFNGDKLNTILLDTDYQLNKN